MGKAINNNATTWRTDLAAARRTRIAAVGITADTLQARRSAALSRDLASGDPRDETKLDAKLRLRENAQLDVQIAKLETEREALDKRIAFLRSQKRP